MGEPASSIIVVPCKLQNALQTATRRLGKNAVDAILNRMKMEPELLNRVADFGKESKRKLRMNHTLVYAVSLLDRRQVEEFLDAGADPNTTMDTNHRKIKVLAWVVDEFYVSRRLGINGEIDMHKASAVARILCEHGAFLMKKEAAKHPDWKFEMGI
ncbi:hypothetical protein KJ780_03355 [Candidatus Micrarchaeota archaeon]|nr:hypothetical protein [Candidatus Micrarchaeota archaeon]